jgi:solute:Na+ symporter, SSS family
VFLLGVLTKRPGENAAVAGVIAGTIVMLFVKFDTTIPFTWWVLIGSTVTFGVGYLSSAFQRLKPVPPGFGRESE